VEHNNLTKPIHVKPSLYAYYFYDLKEIAAKYGYNLVLHGSLARDLDLIAIPWKGELGDVDTMIQEFADKLGGVILEDSPERIKAFMNTYHGRKPYIINLNRSWSDKGHDALYYIDISVTPTIKSESNVQ
jgi:hypothetical protein